MANFELKKFAWFTAVARNILPQNWQKWKFYHAMWKWGTNLWSIFLCGKKLELMKQIHLFRYPKLLSAILEDLPSIRFKPHQVVSGRVQDFSNFGKCSGQQDLFRSDFKTNIDTGQAEGKPVSELVEWHKSEFFGLAMIFSLLAEQKLQKRRTDKNKNALKVSHFWPCIKAFIHVHTAAVYQSFDTWQRLVFTPHPFRMLWLLSEKDITSWKPTRQKWK